MDIGVLAGSGDAEDKEFSSHSQVAVNQGLRLFRWAEDPTKAAVFRVKKLSLDFA
jgi:hypothetical protein